MEKFKKKSANRENKLYKMNKMRNNDDNQLVIQTNYEEEIKRSGLFYQ